MCQKNTNFRRSPKRWHLKYYTWCSANKSHTRIKTFSRKRSWTRHISHTTWRPTTAAVKKLSLTPLSHHPCTVADLFVDLTVPHVGKVDGDPRAVTGRLDRLGAALGLQYGVNTVIRMRIRRRQRYWTQWDIHVARRTKKAPWKRRPILKFTTLAKRHGINTNYFDPRIGFRTWFIPCSLTLCHSCPNQILLVEVLNKLAGHRLVRLQGVLCVVEEPLNVVVRFYENSVKYSCKGHQKL